MTGPRRCRAADARQTAFRKRIAHVAVGLVATGGLALVVSGCGPPNPDSIAPVGMTPTERATVENWIREFAPTRARVYTIRPWRFRNERGAAAGRAAVRVAPPDSLRFDYSGPFRRSGKAAVVGDSALWVVPEEEFGGLVRVAPVFWAAMGIPQPPPPDVQLLALTRPNVRAWQYALDGDTLTFMVRGNPVTRLFGEIRRRGRTLAVTEVDLNPATRFAEYARIDFPGDVSRFEFTVETVDTTATLEPDIWVNNNED